MHNKLFIIILLPILPLLSCEDSKNIPMELKLIAHGGGSIDGKVLSNTYEALIRSIELEYEYIELDLAITSDSFIVATHSWREFNENSGYAWWGDSVPTLLECRSRKLFGQYTPLTEFMIDSVFTVNESLYFVVDKISNPVLLEKSFAKLKNRMIVEAFNYNDYCSLVDKGYYLALYSCMANDLYSSLSKHLVFHRLFSGPKIEWLALHTSVFDYIIYKIIDKVCDFKAALFTVNDTSTIPKKYRDKIEFIYTDSIFPVGSSIEKFKE